MPAVSRKRASRRTTIGSVGLAAISASLWPACAAETDGMGSSGLGQPVHVHLDGEIPRYLSEYKFFSWDPHAGFVFNDRVIPYDLNTALFSDYALKQRAIYIPDGEAATYEDEGVFALPVGSVLIKNFLFAEDMREPGERRELLETRLLVRHEDGWHALPYIWAESQQDAVFSPAGDIVPVAMIDPLGESREADYLIPQRNQCESCHGRQESEDAPVDIVPIGLKARHLDRDYAYGGEVGTRNQLDLLQKLGMLDGLPPAGSRSPAYDFRSVAENGVDAIPVEDVDFAARSYLDINCAHCHDPEAVQGATSQLFLNYDNADPFNLGICKRPGSAGTGAGGFTFDIVPGNPDESILHFRMRTEQLGAMMPLLGRSLTDTQGVDLIRAWIAAMPADDCGSNR